MTSSGRVRLVHGAFVLFAVVLVGRAAQVQLFQTSIWHGVVAAAATLQLAKPFDGRRR